MKSKHLLAIIKYIFSRNSYVCPIWIFIYDTYLAYLYSVGNVGIYTVYATDQLGKCKSSDTNS
jgi:hypothetical protein